MPPSFNKSINVLQFFMVYSIKTRKQFLRYAK